jgi:S-adenosylmethionine:tRNA-ribosyltransferase-isomerase (queuine synthetase)
MKLSAFDYKLPKELISQYPTPNREDSRLMIVDRKTGKFEHKHFRDILNIFNEDDLLIVNNTKVFPARMFGKKEKTGASIEVFLLRELNGDNLLWDVLVDPARKIRNESGQPLEARTPASVSPTMHHNRMQSGVASQNLPSCARSGVSVKNALNVGL